MTATIALSLAAMKVFRYWRLREAGVNLPDEVRYWLRAWGGSNRDESEAESAAQARLEQMRTRLLEADQLKLAGEYEYGSGGAIREEWLERIAGSEDAPTAVVTRNRYGAPVLNAQRLAMIDIDFPEQVPGFRLAFWRKPPDPQAEAIARVRDWQARHQRSVLRIYQTPAGLRVLRTDAAIDADSDEADAMLDELGADALYHALCRRQRCFRARLGPKPWRCGLPLPPGRFPREAAAQAAFEAWLGRYSAAVERHAACRYLETAGEDYATEELRPVLAAHDALSGALTDRPLA
jgi:hypothetical protein